MIEPKSELFGYQLHGSDVYADHKLTQRLSEWLQLQPGDEVYTTGLLGEIRKVTVIHVHDYRWDGRDGYMLVHGEYQPRRYAFVPHETTGGWAATTFADARNLVRARF